MLVGAASALCRLVRSDTNSGHAEPEARARKGARNLRLLEMDRRIIEDHVRSENIHPGRAREFQATGTQLFAGIWLCASYATVSFLGAGPFENRTPCASQLDWQTSGNAHLA